ncbi:MAG TPA: LytTR family transcriptional regulator DNA-binding domain-containing protein [Bacteroidia bacterium]|nr:LytTR family transcriptional regulator DNA-binding domain-containing protein [Bacteroidia bacterium]
MIKTVLIDDEPLARSIIKEYLQGYSEIEIVQECNDGFEGVKAIMHHHPGLIFLDIQMPKINGFEMLELVEPAPAVIFTTAFDEYAMKAFEAHAVDYLLKPFSKERFDKAMQKWLSRNAAAKTEASTSELLNTPAKQPDEQNRVVVKYGSNIRIIPAQEIYYIEAFDDYVKIFTKDDYFLKKKTMNYFEQTLSASEFLRTHRSYIVNIQQITRIEPYEKNSYIALLKNGKKISLSRTGYVRLKEELGL